MAFSSHGRTLFVGAPGINRPPARADDQQENQPQQHRVLRLFSRLRRELGQLVNSELFFDGCNLLNAFLKTLVAEHLFFVFFHSVAQFCNLFGF